jgi:hypothetical protein
MHLHPPPEDLTMSDYQTVTVLGVSGRTIVLDVVEVHPDMDALASVIVDGAISDDDGLRKIAAELVLERNHCDNALCRGAVHVHDTTELWPTHRDLVASVALRSLEPIGESSVGRPRYHAVLAIELTRDEHAHDIAVGEEWGAVATAAHEDVELCDFWDHVR